MISIRIILINFLSIPQCLSRRVLIGALFWSLYSITNIATAIQEPASISYAQETSFQAIANLRGDEPPVRNWLPELIELPQFSALLLSGPEAATPMQVGDARTIPALKEAYSLSRQQIWHPTERGGLAFGFQITSPGAKAIRLGLVVRKVPNEAIVTFYTNDNNDVHKVTGAEILASLQRNRAAGETGEDAETFWSPVIEGESQIMDIELPPGFTAEDIDIAVPKLSHLFYSLLNDNLFESLAALSCHNDVSCYPEWSPESNATAKMVFTKGGSSYLCTGTLLNYKNNTTFIPYFLTANHCIGSQSVASSLQTYWFYRSSSCDGPSGSYQTRYGGAELLYATDLTDTSFMRLSTQPPSGAAWSGWSATLPESFDSLTGIHHPVGDLQKISFGNVADYLRCVFDGSDVDYCEFAEQSTSTAFLIQWISGLAEPGSSGSGIFNASHQLVGTASVATPATCQGDNFAGYGRFDIPYTNSLYRWLDNPGVPLLNSAVLPYARAVRVGVAATAFGTVINSGTATASECSLQMPSGLPVTFSYQTTDSNNVLIGSPDTPVDIPAGGTQGFVFGITPSAAFAATEIPVIFDCANSDPASSHNGLNTFILSASNTEPPDLLAVGATPSGDGVVRLANNTATAFFATAAINLGSESVVTVSADDGENNLPIDLNLCETTAAGTIVTCGEVLSRTAAAGQILYYTVFVTGIGEPVPFDPANNRLFLRFAAGGTTVGATNVAVTAP